MEHDDKIWIGNERVIISAGVDCIYDATTQVLKLGPGKQYLTGFIGKIKCGYCGRVHEVEVCPGCGAPVMELF